jgi:hypothetical protein
MTQSGRQPPGGTPKYPEDSAQGIVGDWWIEKDQPKIARGRLIWAFLPHASQDPYILIPERGEPVEHKKFTGKFEPLRMSTPAHRARTPVAALPEYPGEVYGVYRVKKRPAIIISPEGREVEKALKLGGAGWQTNPTMLVAPYYGVDRTAQRAGWPPAFIERIRRCEYPQYVWDMLPLKGPTQESVLRLDQIHPVGTRGQAYELTPYVLSDGALRIFNEWVTWLVDGGLPEDGDLKSLQDMIRDQFDPKPEKLRAATSRRKVRRRGPLRPPLRGQALGRAGPLAGALVRGGGLED